MKKLLLTLILLAPFFINASPACSSWNRRDLKTRVIHGNKKFAINDCSCQCTGLRTEKNICLQCGHGQRAKILKTRPEDLVQKVEDTVKNIFDATYDFSVDLISTDTGTKNHR